MKKFFSNAKVCSVAGYLEILSPNKNENQDISNLNNLKKGQQVSINKIEVKEMDITGRKLFVKALEEELKKALEKNFLLI